MMTSIDLRAGMYRLALAAGIAAAFLLAAPAQAQRTSLDSLAADHDAIADVQNGGATPIVACTVIDQPGSYVVTQNLVAAGGDCLFVTADNVTIDLGGFVLSGGGVGRGVATDGSGADRRANIAVRNGSVTGFANGIDLGFAIGSAIEGVRATDNSNHGIVVGERSTASGNTAINNGGTGIRDLGIDSIIASSTASGNAGPGISTSGGAVTGNMSSRNGDAGIIAGIGSTVTENSAKLNGGEGLRVSCPSNVIGNTATTNTGANLSLIGGGCNAVNNVAP